MNAVPPPPRGAPGGFVLVATLLVLAVLAALGAFIDRMVETDVERARLARQSLQDELNRHATEATLLYLISTNRKNHKGMLLENEQQFLESMDDAPLPESGDGELTMASAAYQGLGRMRFAMQDEWGLVPVNVPDSLMLESLLGHVGVSSAGIARLVPRMEDYIDLDDRIGLNGAERIDYRQRGMPPPANWFMVSHLELKNVLGADRIISPVQWREMAPVLTARGVGMHNFNTMHPEVLASFLGLDEVQVRRVLDARAERPLNRPSQIAMLTGRFPRINEDSIVTYPSPYVRISIWPEGGAVRSIAGFSMTPGGVTPWRTEYRYVEHLVDHGSEAPLRAATPLL